MPLTSRRESASGGRGAVVAPALRPRPAALGPLRGAPLPILPAGPANTPSPPSPPSTRAACPRALSRAFRHSPRDGHGLISLYPHLSVCLADRRTG